MKSRRAGIFSSLTIAALVLSGCGAGMGGGTAGPDDAAATGDFDWKRFSGTTIQVMLNEYPWTDGIKEELASFTEATGITVDVKSYAEDLYFDKMNQALRTNTPPDVIMTGFDYSVATQQAAGLLEPVTPYLDNPSLTTADYDLADFPQGVLAPAMFADEDGKQNLYGIPISTETYILFYNKDLVDEYLGGTVPATMDALLAAAQKITREGKQEVFGSVVRGIRSSAIVDIPTALVFNEWAKDAPAIELPYNVWFDGSWDKPRMTEPGIVAGMSDYAGLIAAGPPNKFNLDWPDANALFSQGKAAFYIDASIFGPSFEDPSQSAIAGKVGYSTLPQGAEGGTTGLWSWGLSIPKASQHKGAAWLFTQWVTDKANTAKIGALTGGPPRQSAADMSVYTDALNADYVVAVKDSMATARATAVIKSDIEEALLVIADSVIAIASGGEPDTVMDDAQATMKSLMK